MASINDSSPQLPGSPAVLLVDDDTECLVELATMLSGRGIASASAPDAQTAERLLRGQPTIAAMLVDQNLVSDRGTHMIRRFREEGIMRHGTQVLFATAQASKADVLQALRLGALDFIEKPLEPQSLIVSIKYALQLSARSRRDGLTAAADDLSDHPEPYLATLNRVDRLERTRAEVFEGSVDPVAWQILSEAYRGLHQGRPLSLRATSMVSGQPYSSCVRTLGRLEERGLVMTFPNQFDRRRSLFVISEAGKMKIELLLRRTAAIDGAS